MKNIVVKTMIIISIVAIPTTLALNPHLIVSNETNHMIVEIQGADLDQTLFYLLPSTAQYNNIEVVIHNYNKVPAPTPKTKFYSTDSPYPEIISLECVKTKSIYYDVLEKGNFDVIRIYVPSVYYSDGYKHTTTSLTLHINYDYKPKSFTTQKDTENIGGLVENPGVLTTFETQTQNYQPESPDYEYVIVTNSSFWETINNEFKSWKISNDAKINNIWIVNVSNITSDFTFDVNGSYGDATNDTGGNHWITDDEEVTSSYNLFNDTQAMIRNFLRYCYDVHNTRYVLLLGDRNYVPPRMVASYAAGTCPGCTDFHNDSSHASDMYYACLHNNMNNNTNSYFMENNLCGNDYDKIDWGYDLCVGRVPVTSCQDVYNWTNKTKAYINGNSQGNYLTYGMVPAKDNGGSVTNTTWLMFGDEFPANISFVNNQNLSSTQYENAKEYVNGNETGIDGITLILQSGHYNSFWSYYNSVLADNNDMPNFYYSEGCSEGAFGEGQSHMDEVMIYDGAAFAGIANSAYGWFVASTYYVEEMMSQMFNATTGNFTMTFCKAHNDAREIYGHDVDCVWGMIVKETNFFGDPALEWTWNTTYSPQASDIEIVNISNMENGTTFYPNTTLVFNWSTVENTSYYQFQISNNSAFTDLVVNLSNVSFINYPTYLTEFESNMSFILPPANQLTDYKMYYCRVRAYAS